MLNAGSHCKSRFQPLANDCVEPLGSCYTADGCDRLDSGETCGGDWVLLERRRRTPGLSTRTRGCGGRSCGNSLALLPRNAGGPESLAPAGAHAGPTEILPELWRRHPAEERKLGLAVIHRNNSRSFLESSRRKKKQQQTKIPYLFVIRGR